MDESLSLFWSAFGAVGYTLTMSLAIACTGLGVAMLRAGRNRARAMSFTISAALFALFFAYLIVASAEPPWLDRFIWAPILRTVGFGAAVSGWVHLALVLGKERKVERLSTLPGVRRNLENA
jgi:uncharacterized membrane protein (DUF485 family)